MESVEHNFKKGNLTLEHEHDQLEEKEELKHEVELIQEE
jgi:methyltransferase-like protein